MAVVRSTKIPKRRDAAGEEVAGYQDTLVRARKQPLVSFTLSRLIQPSHRLGRARHYVPHQRLPIRGPTLHPLDPDRNHVSPRDFTGSHLDDGQGVPRRLQAKSHRLVSSSLLPQLR